MEENALVYQVNPVSRITGEGRAEFLRAWGSGFDHEGARRGGGDYTMSSLQDTFFGVVRGRRYSATATPFFFWALTIYYFLACAPMYCCMRCNVSTAPLVSPQPKAREKAFGRRRTACQKKVRILCRHTLTPTSIIHNPRPTNLRKKKART